MRETQASWRPQPRRAYLAAVFKFVAVNLATGPIAYGLIARGLEALGRDFDRFVNSSVRAFRPGPLLPQLEVKPSAPLLATLAHRLRAFDGVRLRRRAAAGEYLSGHLPDHVTLAGHQMELRTHWLFPVVSPKPDDLIRACRRVGIDAARGASSVTVVAAPAERPEAEAATAARMMSSLVFLPAYPELRRRARAPDGGDREREPDNTSVARGRVPAPEAGMRAPRAEAWSRLATIAYDLLVIGGGIIGSRIAFEAARAGMKVALVDAGDFGGATSSASSKLIHGGFRYLPRGDLSLVWESQRERRALMDRVAPHVVRRMPIVLAAYRGGSRGPLTAAAGVLAYGAMCGFRATGVGFVGAGAAQRLVPELRTDGLSVCGLFDEGQTNDARLVLATVAAAADLGANVVNHARVVGFDRPGGRLATAWIQGREGEQAVEAQFRFVVNASGPWVDRLRQLEDPSCEPMARLSKGVHLLIEPRSEWHAGLVVPAEDGRVTLALPWQGMLMLGTTDTEFEGDPADCAVNASDVAQVLAEASVALPGGMLRPDSVRFSFAGLRVLPIGGDITANAHREHLVRTGRFGMVSIAGGKLTTHRRIAMEALRRLPDPRLSRLHLVDVPLPAGAPQSGELADQDIDPEVVRRLVDTYGGDASAVVRQRRMHPDALDRIDPKGPDVWAQVYHAVENEWAITVEDVVRRRTTVAIRGLASASVRSDVARVLDATRPARVPA
ncbi:MAG: hypothetical protein NVS1B3_13640 [Candidatus Dormibacteraceae bacterium]